MVSSMSRENETPCGLVTDGDVIFNAFLLAGVLALTLFGNFLVVGTVVKTEKLRIVPNYFVISLAVSDICVGLIAVPFKIDRLLHQRLWCHGTWLCMAGIVADIACNHASIWNLVLISIDRSIAILYPLRYRDLMTKRRACSLIASVWCASILFALLGILNWTALGEEHIFSTSSCQKYDRIYYTVATIVSFLLPLSVILVAYGFVFNIASSQAKAVVASFHGSHVRRFSTTASFIRGMKAARTLAIVVSAFIICWLPFFVILMVYFWSPTFNKWQSNNQVAFDFIEVIFVYILTSLNSAINPFIYASFNTKFRREFLKCFYSILQFPRKLCQHKSHAEAL